MALGGKVDDVIEIVLLEQAFHQLLVTEDVYKRQPFHNVMRFDQILVTSILTSLSPTYLLGRTSR